MFYIVGSNRSRKRVLLKRANEAFVLALRTTADDEVQSQESETKEGEIGGGGVGEEGMLEGNEEERREMEGVFGREERERME